MNKTKILINLIFLIIIYGFWHEKVGADACVARFGHALFGSNQYGASGVECSTSAFIVSVIKDGEGVINTTPAGISCGSTCSASFNSGTNVTLTATPDSNYTFTGWSGDCSGTGDCTLTINSNRNVTATFTYSPPPSTSFNLTVSKTGAGSVSSQPTGIDCGATCSSSFGSGTTVELTAQPDNGFEFSGWGGACSGTAACSVLMDGDKPVSANFVEVHSYPVMVSKQSGGLVTSEPQGIVCGGSNKQCRAQFSAVQLTATPNAGFEFIRWVGCESRQQNVCSLQLTKKTTVKAVFKALPRFTLKVTKNKLGSVISAPAGLKCPDKKKSCTAKFIKGMQVTLTAVPQAGRLFAGWTGVCSGLDACTVVMDGGKGVAAMFE